MGGKVSRPAGSDNDAGEVQAGGRPGGGDGAVAGERKPGYIFRPPVTMNFRLAFTGAALAAGLFLSSCVTDERHLVEVSVPDQRMAVYRDGVRIREYPVSTSKFGLGDDRGSKRTPLGELQIAKKIGANAPAGTVFKSRKRTGEVLPPNAPGRDPIVTRILWLKGLESQNSNAYSRYIYIHGTRRNGPSDSGELRVHRMKSGTSSISSTSSGPGRRSASRTNRFLP